ncbi:MAG: hypothetical protein AB8F34_06925 [Akkermansiaceae bacterium]
MKNITKYALFGAVLALVTPAQADKKDCYQIYTAVKKAVTAQPSKVLELVKTSVAQNESCACEIVKAAIVASDADKKLVAGIVESAISSAPEKVRIIGQCAVAVAPDALAEVQAVVTKYGAGSGDSGYSAKGSEKDAKVCTECKRPYDYQAPGAHNVLDFPLGLSQIICGTCNRPYTPGGPGGSVVNVVGPTPGGPGGFPLFPPGDGLQPPTVTPPSATD